MQKGLWATMCVWGAVLMFAIPAARAGEVDLLVQKLVEKNILTPNEAQILLDDTRQEVAKQNAKGKNDAIPSWVQTIKIKGDMRLRYQSQVKEGSGAGGVDTTRNRGRIRYRLGIEGKPNDQFTVGAGLASGGLDPRSTNTTLGTNTSGSGAFAKAAINLDYAFAEYMPSTSLRLIGGKYAAGGKGYLWNTTDMLWDSDVNQEGLSAHAEFNNVLGADVFMNTGYWLLEESSSTQKDIGMYYGQAGFSVNPIEPVEFKLAGTVYGNHFGGQAGTLKWRTDSVSGTPDSGFGNTTATQTDNGTSRTAYAYKFNPVYAGSAEMLYSWPEETSSPIKMVGIFGDYVMNPDPSSENTGWAAGLKFGHKKVGAMKGDWQMKYQYIALGKDAWFDSFPDSDRYGGWTNVKGHEIILGIGLSKNVSLDLDYYRSDKLKGASVPETMFQADLNFKF